MLNRICVNRAGVAFACNTNMPTLAVGIPTSARAGHRDPTLNTQHLRLVRTYKFLKEGSGWYIDLPEYLEKGGSKADLAMVAGADDMLDIMSEGNDSVSLQIDTTPFDHAERVELVEVCDATIGGGYYVMPVYNGEKIDKRMWLCEVTEFVFGYLPKEIFVRKVSGE